MGEKGCYSAGSDQIRGCYSTPYTGLGRCRVSAEDGRTTADDAEQAFHRAVGGQREHKPIIAQFRCLYCRFKADYDALQLAFDSPWVYRSNYSFDLINWLRIWFSKWCTRCARRNASMKLLPRWPRSCRGGRGVARVWPGFLVATNPCPSCVRVWPRMAECCSGVAGSVGSGILSNTWRAGFIFILFFI